MTSQADAPRRLSRRAVCAGLTAGAAVGMSAPALAYVPAPPGHPAWVEDAQVLRRVYGALHPGLTRYLNEAEVNAAFDGLEARIGRAAHISEAFTEVAATLSKFRCGHSYPNFYNQDAAVKRELFEGADKLPFHFRWLGERMIVTAPKDAEGLVARGDEILSIGNYYAAEIQRQLLRYVRADGSNIGKQRALLSVQGGGEFETFDIFYALAMPNGRTHFNVEVAGQTGPARRLQLPAIDLRQRQAQSSPPPAKDAPLWTFTDEAPGAAVLTMPTWAVYNTKWDWKAFLDDVFERLAAKNTPALILDIRANEGGLDCGDEIIARLIDAPLARTAYARRVRYQRVPDDLLPYLSTWDNGFKDWGAAAIARSDGYYDLKRAGDEDSAPIAPKGPRFKGKVIVLISATNSSATFGFADLIQRAKLGVLVGQTTGGNRRGINGGAFFFLRLPQTRLEVDVPLIAYHPATPMPDAGVDPDVAIEETRDDITAGRDAVMEAARRLLV